VFCILAYSLCRRIGQTENAVSNNPSDSQHDDDDRHDDPDHGGKLQEKLCDFSHDVSPHFIQTTAGKDAKNPANVSKRGNR